MASEIGPTTPKSQVLAELYFSSYRLFGHFHKGFAKARASDTPEADILGESKDHERGV
jgi:hypothetical protein